MGCGIGAQEELRIAGGGGAPQGDAVQFPLGHRQAVEVRPQAAGKHGVAVDVQVVGRDRGSQVGRARAHKIDRIDGGDVLQHHLQARMAPQ